MLTVVELEGVDGEMWTLAGPDAGDRGVELATDVTGLYDPPVKVVYETPGNYPGARYLNHRILRRDIVFGVEILNDKNESWLTRDSEWAKSWAFDRDCKLYITTEESGTRWLNLRLLESIDVSWKHDPTMNSLNRAGMICVAGDPFWYEEMVEYSVTTETDTTGITDINDEAAEQLQIVVDPADGKGGLNPTNQPIFPKWVLPAPSRIAVPDYSYMNPALANRRILMPSLLTGEDCVIDTDPRVEQVASENNTQLWARMNGVRWRNPIPPYTRDRTFNLTVIGCPADQIITLKLPRPWTRPWGLE